MFSKRPFSHNSLAYTTFLVMLVLCSSFLTEAFIAQHYIFHRSSFRDTKFIKSHPVAAYIRDEWSAQQCATDLLQILSKNQTEAISRNRYCKILSSVKPLAPLILYNARKQKPKKGEKLFVKLLPYLKETCEPRKTIKVGKFSTPINLQKHNLNLVRNLLKTVGSISEAKYTHQISEISKRILYPPKSILKLAESSRTFGSSGFLSHLENTKLNIPDVEGSYAARCQLGRYTWGRRFSDESLNSYFSFLFEALQSLGPKIGLPLNLSRFDLFHGHFFISRESQRLGILFHAREYPELSEKFPIPLGYCQKGSKVPYDNSINFRNILWLAPIIKGNLKKFTMISPGTLVVLDTTPGTIFYEEMIMEGLEEVRTIYEGSFGEVIADINYFGSLQGIPKMEKLFIC